MLLIHINTVLAMLILNKGIENVLGLSRDWKTIETLAEEHPYIIGILNHAKNFVCSGTIINKRTVLTSGRCINPEPFYVAVGRAVFNENVNNKTIFEIALTKLHEDYIFDVHDNDIGINHMHSNIGLIFVVRPLLDLFIESANIGKYYATELKDKKIFMIGYGNTSASKAVTLQQQAYHQIACTNPKWYYCVCGIEYSSITYEEPFGEGAPVLYNDVVVGIAASPTGSLRLNRNLKYNIFTVIGPYLPWIEKSKSNLIITLTEKRNNGVLKFENDKCLITIIMIITFRTLKI